MAPYDVASDIHQTLILGWIVWGTLTITATFVEDLCFAMKGYLVRRCMLAPG